MTTTQNPHGRSAAAELQAYNQRREEKMAAALKQLDEAFAAKTIEPGAFNDLSYNIKNGYDRARDVFKDEICDDIKDHHERYLFLDLFPYSMAHCAGRLKKLELARKKAADNAPISYRSPNGLLELPKDRFSKVVAFFEKWVAISEKLDKLKTMKAAKKPSKKETEEQEKKRYLAPRQSSEAMQKVRDLLEESVKSQYADLMKWMQESYQRMYESIVETVAKTFKGPKAYKEYYEALRYFPDWHCFYETLDPRSPTLPQPKPGVKNTVKRLAERRAEEVKDHFIYKNMKKLAAILAGKEKKGVKIVESRVVHGQFRSAFEGEIFFLFSDKTSFYVRNKIVLKSLWNSPGQFAQYPTTFHQVKFADERIEAMVPEQEMVEKWAKE